jgi:two-component system LytT family response regulator
MLQLKAVIIDDEKPARMLTANYLRNHPQIEIVAECEDGFQGIVAIRQFNPDIVFLDIQMPKLNGFEMIELLDNNPKIIFTTAYDEFALQAFEIGAIDYLLKPYSQKRFDVSLSKALTLMAEPIVENEYHKMLDFVSGRNEIINRIVVKNNGDIRIILTTEINHLEAQDDYVFIYTLSGERFLKNTSMKYLESHLDNTQFIRVHRSHIVQINQIRKIELWEKDSHLVILKNNKSVPVSKTGYKLLKSVLEI